MSARDAKLVSTELEGLGHMFRAIHYYATEDRDALGREANSIVLECLAKQGIRTLDACIEKLGGMQLGNFATVFEDE